MYEMRAVIEGLGGATGAWRRTPKTGDRGASTAPRRAYAEPGEVVQIGQPLYKIADLTNVTVRAFVTGTQLAQAKIGGEATVTFDAAADRRETAKGTITWVSSEAEFTPTPIQTRDERADLVYAVKLRVANPQGLLKIGMPVDVTFGSGQ